MTILDQLKFSFECTTVQVHWIGGGGCCMSDPQDCVVKSLYERLVGMQRFGINWTRAQQPSGARGRRAQLF